MHLKVYTIEDLFEIGKAIIRNDTGIQYPFQKRTLHRALLRTASIFGADTSIQTLRLTHGMTLEGLSGSLLERKGLEYNTPIREATPARLIGRAIPMTVPSPADYTLPTDAIVMRPATSTQSAIEFRLEAASVIPVGGAIDSANLISAVCTVYGITGNGVPVTATPIVPPYLGMLELKYPVNGIRGFQVTSDSAGGAQKQSDQQYRSDIRQAARGRHESTWAGIEKLLKTVKMESGYRVTIAKVFEDFTASRVWAIIDDGSGTSAIVGPINATTYDISLYPGGGYWEYQEHGNSIYVQLPQYHMPYWNDLHAGIGGAESAVMKYTAATGAWTNLVVNTDYYVDIDSGRLALVTSLVPGDMLRVWFVFYTSLVGMAARYVNGITGDPTLTGWRPVGQPIRIRAPFTVTTPSISGTMIFNPGFDSQFGRELATTYVMTYMDSINIGESAKYGIVNHIVNSVPGVKSVDDLLLGGLAQDANPTNPFGVVRSGTISL